MLNSDDLNNLLAKLSTQYGYDFLGYSKASLIRRIQAFCIKEKIDNADDLEKSLMADRRYFIHFVEEVTVNVTEMFRDPTFFAALREKIIPVLATYPFIRIWHAGCSTGEEVYSMAILLREAGLLHKCIIYATDINQKVVERAKQGVFPLSQMRLNSENYIKAGGREEFSKYYSANYHHVQFDKSLADRVVFSTHNLVSDSSFNEFQLILCRNVLIYFERSLQTKVFQLFDKSLDSLGFLALGNKESIRFSDISDYYVQVDKKERIWRKKK